MWFIWRIKAAVKQMQDQKKPSMTQLKLSMPEKRMICLPIIIVLMTLLAAVYPQVASAAATPASANGFEAYKKAQKLHDLQLMAKWGNAQEKQKSLAALNKIKRQQQKAALRQEAQQQKLALAAIDGHAVDAKNKKKTAKPHKRSAKAEKLMVVNINQATEAQLMAALLGIGEVKAKAIVKYRKDNGAFKNMDDLLLVKGIGPATLEKNRDRVRFK